ncbi:MAG: proteobacterial dedicated sortase system response regulator [Pseudomonadota bacterium]
MPEHILIVEDDLTLAANYCDALKERGFQVTHRSDRASAEAAVADSLPDVAIIDIALGADQEGGFELCRSLRARSAELPIVFLTARDQDIDIVSGFRLGADDYLTKNISLAHLQARISALLARSRALRGREEQQTRLERGQLLLDIERMEARWQGIPVALTVTEYWMVEALARRPGHVRSRQQLMDAANTVLDDSTITSHIKRIRRKFQQSDSEFSAIETAYGMGYRWLEQ